MKLTVLYRGDGWSDFDIGFLDGKHAVGMEGAWYVVPEGTAVRNGHEGFVYIAAEGGQWKPFHEGIYRGEITGADLTEGGPDYEEEGFKWA